MGMAQMSLSAVGVPLGYSTDGDRWNNYGGYARGVSCAQMDRGSTVQVVAGGAEMLSCLHVNN